jgi:putative aldouronate transport system substrate-binding protein
MKRTIIRSIALFLAGAIILTENGCSPGGNDKEEPREKVTIMTISFNPGKSNTGEYAEEIRKRIEDYCDCELEIIWVSNDLMEEKADLALASPDTMPMIMTYGGAVTAKTISAAKNGLFVNLNDYIWDSEKYPNLSRILPSVAASLSVDGQLIAIPRARAVGRYGLCYRTDWAEKLGLKEPATPKDVYDMLYAFTYGDPDGNGKDDTVGLEMCNYTGPFDIIQTWFGCGNGWADVNGYLIPVHMQPEYVEALDYIKKLYDDGLMPADWAARPTETWADGCKTGKNGMFIDVMDSGRRIWDYFVADTTFTPSVTDPEKPASMTLYGAVNGHTLATSGYNGYFTLSSSSCDTPDKVDAALRFLDRLCDDEMLILTQYGIEGVNYTVNGDIIEMKDAGNPTLINNYADLNQMLAYLPSTEHVTTPHVKDTERLTAQKQAYEKAATAAVSNPASVYLVNSATYAEVGTSLQESIDTARTRYIYGEITKEELLKVNNEWLKRGGQSILNEVNALYRSDH